MTTMQQVITIVLMALMTVATRALPFIVFPPGHPTPRFVAYLGRVLPVAVFGMLVVYCLKDVTWLGGCLRRTSLDELPQLWNVIRGDMSLVGPRPIVQAEVVRYGKNIREYYMVLPGITGMWQVSGRSDTTYPERVAMDVWYVRNWSVWIDIMYLFKTFKAVVAGKGAY